MDALEDRPDVRAALAGDLLVFHHRQPMTAATVDAVERVAERVSAAARSRVSHLVITDAGVPPPDPAVRSRLIRFARGNDLAAFAIVLRGRRFGAAAVRTALAGVKLLVRTKYPIGVFASVDEAMRWLAEKSCVPGDSCAAQTRELEAFVDQR